MGADRRQRRQLATRPELEPAGCRTSISRKVTPTMTDEIRQFVLDSLTDMNYSIEGIDDDTTLGPAGADLESLVLAELAVRVEDKYGVKVSEGEAEGLGGVTVGEFCSTVASRMSTPLAATSE